MKVSDCRYGSRIFASLNTGDSCLLNGRLILKINPLPECSINAVDLTANRTCWIEPNAEVYLVNAIINLEDE